MWLPEVEELVRCHPDVSIPHLLQWIAPHCDNHTDAMFELSVFARFPFNAAGFTTQLWNQLNCTPLPVGVRPVTGRIPFLFLR